MPKILTGCFLTYVAKKEGYIAVPCWSGLVWIGLANTVTLGGVATGLQNQASFRTSGRVAPAP